jgi:hypothetical protein
VGGKKPERIELSHKRLGRMRELAEAGKTLESGGKGVCGRRIATTLTGWAKSITV